MKTFIRSVLMLVCCLSCVAQTRQRDNNLESRKVTIESTTLDASSLLSDLAAHYKVPIGFESIGPDGEEPAKEIKINIQNGTVRDVLDELVRADPRYKWEMVDGVINVGPVTDRENFLDVVVDSFSISPKASRLEIRKALTNLPQVKAILENEGVRPMHVMLSSADVREISPTFSLNSSNVKVRTILNKIIVESDSHFWVVSRFGKERNLLIVNF